MKKTIEVYTGSFSIEHLNGIPYLTCENQKMHYTHTKAWSEARAAGFFQDFIKLRIPYEQSNITLTQEQLTDIRNYTDTYGVLCDIASFDDNARENGYILTASATHDFPFQAKVAMPIFQFVYFHSLMVNVYALMDELSRTNDQELITQLLYLLFQPYAGLPYESADPFPGLMDSASIGNFPRYIWEFHKGQKYITLPQLLNIMTYLNTETSKIRNLTDTIGGKYSLNFGDGYSLHSGFIANIGSPEYQELFICLDTINRNFDIGNFILSGDKKEIQKKDKTKHIDVASIRNISKLVIAQTVDAYLPKKTFILDDDNRFISRYPANFLIFTIFEEFANICEFYELRTCHYQKCRTKFVYKKGKPCLCCSHSCADNYSKYKKRHYGEPI